jgi:predicted alpha/beta hydrolase
MTQWHKVSTDNEVTVPLLVAEPEGTPSAALILLPALGIRAKFYTALAQGLAKGGVLVVVLEQRGNGESAYRPGDGSRFDLKDYLHRDLDAALRWLKAKPYDGPLYIGGHSLGGHVASMAAAEKPARFAGVIHFACGFPYAGDYRPPASFFIRFLIALIPLMTYIIGYFPGSRLGLGGREYRGLMMDWCQWARSGSYNIKGFEKTEEGLAAYRGRVLSLAFEQDTLASAKSIDRSCAVYKSAHVSKRKLGAAEQGAYLGHINWGKKPDGAVATVLDWLKQS